MKAIYLMDKNSAGLDELEHDCKVHIDLGPSKHITIDVGAQDLKSDTVVIEVVGGKPFAKLAGNKLMLGIKEN